MTWIPAYLSLPVAEGGRGLVAALLALALPETRGKTLDSRRLAKLTFKFQRRDFRLTGREG